jgi:hypothetical protein
MKTTGFRMSMFWLVGGVYVVERLPDFDRSGTGLRGGIP